MRYSITQIAGRTVRRQMRILSLVSVLSVGLGTLASLNAQSLTWLGTLGGSTSRALGVNDNGLMVIGEARIESEMVRAFRWTAATGMVSLGVLPASNSSTARGVSSDGQRIVGTSPWTRQGAGGVPSFGLQATEF